MPRLDKEEKGGIIVEKKLKPASAAIRLAASNVHQSGMPTRALREDMGERWASRLFGVTDLPSTGEGEIRREKKGGRSSDTRGWDCGTEKRSHRSSTAISRSSDLRGRGGES